MFRYVLLVSLLLVVATVHGVARTDRAFKHIKRRVTTHTFDSSFYTDKLLAGFPKIKTCANTQNCVDNVRMILKFCGIERDIDVGLESQRVELENLKYWVTSKPSIAVCEYKAANFKAMVTFMKHVNHDAYANALREVNENEEANGGEDHAFVLFHTTGDGAKTYIWDSWLTRWNLQAREFTWPGVEVLVGGDEPTDQSSIDTLNGVKDMLLNDAPPTILWSKAVTVLNEGRNPPAQPTASDTTKNVFVYCNVIEVTAAIEQLITSNLALANGNCNAVTTDQLTYLKGQPPRVIG